MTQKPRIREFTEHINPRDYCANCQRTGMRGKPFPRGGFTCKQCGGMIWSHIADHYTKTERVEAVLPVSLTNDNEGRTRHWSAAHKRKDAYVNTLQLYGFFRHEPPLYKQRVTLTRILSVGERFWDWDSILRGSAKELIDAMAKLKWFLNDSPRWVVGVAGEQDDSLRRTLGGHTRIVVEKAG